jgi:hypothetical protein
MPQPGARRAPVRTGVKKMIERLEKTLEHASKHPFYKEIWGDELYRKIKSLARGSNHLSGKASVFNELPVIQRSELEKVVPYFQEESPIVSVRHTSGTSGKPLHRYRGLKELESKYPVLSSEELNLALHVVQTYHGGPSVFPTRTIDFYCNVLDEGSLRNSVRLLSERFDYLGGRQVSLIYSPWLHLTLLTSWMIDNGVDPKAFGVRKILAFGGHYSPFIDSILNDFWGGIVEPRYSLSEVGYAASHIKGKGYKLKSTTNCLVQLIRLSGQCYSITFTELFPSGFNQPVVKYSPGDIVRVDNEIFNILGRDKYSLFCDGKLLIGSNQIRDALDKPFIPRAAPQYSFHGDIAKYAYPIAAKVSHLGGNRISVTLKEKIPLEGEREVIDGMQQAAKENGFNELVVEINVDRDLIGYHPK